MWAGEEERGSCAAHLLELSERHLGLGALSAGLGGLVVLHPRRPEVLVGGELALDPMDDGLLVLRPGKGLERR